ncbi:ATP-binding protein [Alkalihalobacillus sp. CinArs1]|uniref:ATP-binding protein n=1 Tax=Alkalihalobacillus sp. CinArs1 TaxID=2995314 RepID=UPI0022DD930D|nr:ATP-binding protein [Alkalihalobacillus sp. CinArs1]
MLDMARPLLVNIAMLFSVLFIWNMVMPFTRSRSLSLKDKILYGVISSLMALLCMLFPLEKFGDTVFDLRVVPLILVTLYGGAVPGVICAVVISITRFSMGGEFAYVGVSLAIIAFVLAWGYRGLFERSIQKWNVILKVGSIFIITYISIILWLVKPSEPYFYPIYFLSFAIAYFFIFYLTEKLVIINLQLEETVYLEKLSVAGKMAASIAHEIRNPLTTVRGLLQFISTGAKDQQVKKYAPLMLDEIDRTNKIITDYLTLIKPTKLDHVEVHLNKVVSDTIELTSVLGVYHAVKISYEENGDFRILTNPQEMKQCLINLIKNSIEAIEKDGLIEISLQNGTKRNTVDIVIKDNGSGMSDEELKKIGLPFYTTKSKGTGLGTMITNRLIRNMNGKISYESTIGLGTTVTVTLPTLK